MAERRDIPDALREAVERTVQATVDTRQRAQGAMDEVSETVDELARAAERQLKEGRKNVRSVVGERLPASQEDVRAIGAALLALGDRLESIEHRLGSLEGPAPARSGKSAKPAKKPGATKRTSRSAKTKAAAATSESKATPATAKTKAAPTKPKAKGGAAKSKSSAAKPERAKASGSAAAGRGGSSGSS